jgi:hypothetical protein
MFEDLIPWLALSREDVEDLSLFLLLFSFAAIVIASGGLD